MQKVLLAYIVISLFICSLSAQAPDWLWAKQAGGSSDDWGKSIAVDDNGNTYVTGYFESPTLSFGNLPPLSNSGGRDIFVAKLDAEGNWLWAKQAGSPYNDMGISITVDNNGNTYVTGTFDSSTLIFGNLPPLTNAFFVGYDIFVAKLDTNGNWLWAKQAGGSEDDMGISITVDNNGNTFVTGHSDSFDLTFGNLPPLINSGSYDIFIVKLDTTGNWVWAKQAGGLGIDFGYGIAVDNNDCTYVTGSFYSATLTFGILPPLTNSGGDDIFVAKLDANGNWLWAKQAGGIDYESCFSIAVDNNGNTYVTGGFLSFTLIFGNLPPLANSGGSEIFVAKLDTTGNWLWAKQAGGTDDDLARGIVVDTNSNTYITGTYESTTPTFGNLPPLSNSGARDIYIAKLDSNGNWVWAKQAIGSYYDEVFGIAVDNNGSTYVTGNFDSLPLSFGNLPPLISSGFTDLFVAKLDNNGTAVEEHTSHANTDLSILETAYPNPFKIGQQLTLTAEVKAGESGILSIYNVKGQSVKTFKVKSGHNSINWNAEGLSGGVYLYTLSTPSIQQTKKLIIIK